jgi:small-conductance mechanosensitive channel
LTVPAVFLLAPAAVLAAPVEMYKTRIEPEALLEVMSKPQLLLSLATLVLAALLGILLRRVIRQSALAAGARQLLSQASWLGLAAATVFVLATIWQPKLGAIQLVFAAIAVALARGMTGLTRPLLGFFLKAGRRGLQRGAVISVGELSGRLTEIGPLTSTLAIGRPTDPELPTGAVAVFSNGLMMTQKLVVLRRDQPIEIKVTVVAHQAQLAAQRLARAAALACPGSSAELRLCEAFADKATLTLVFDSARSDVPAIVVRDQIYQRYLDLYPVA